MIKLNPLKCPSCGAVISGKMRDLVYRCNNCGTFVYAPTGNKINVKIYRYEYETEDKKYYIPFLTYLTRAEIYSEENIGLFATHGEGGEYITYLPAGGNLPSSEVLRIAKMLTSNPPKNPIEINDFEGHPRLPMEMSIEEGEKMAEFIFLSYEVDRPGVLQRINYSFNAKFQNIIYIPFYYGGYYYPALRGYGGEKNG